MSSTAVPYAPLTIYQKDPLNAGAPLEHLRRSFLTPADLFFIRTHGSLPVVDRDAYRLAIGGMVQNPLEFSLDDLLTRFPQRTVTATLACAGNRRNELAAIHPLPGEVLWQTDAISTARWRGVRLADVLRTAGIGAGARYVAFRGLDQEQVKGESVHFGGSIRLEKALAPEVLLAYEMNDAPLAPEHGFPLRVLVPGYIGARSVKWVQEITLQSQPSSNHFQAREYKIFPPEVTKETADWERGKTLEEIALNAAICAPRNGEARKAGPNYVQGYAIGGEAPVERVELSIDQGATWIAATLSETSERWAWRFWDATLNLPPGACEIVVRAWDAAGRTQPEDARSLWNFKGYANHAWHRIHLSLS